MRMRDIAKKTLLAAIVAWFVTRALRRVLGLVLLATVLAGALTIAERHGVDVDDARRVVRCQTRAIARAVEHLRHAASSSSPSSTARPLRGHGRCHLASTSTASRRDRGARR